MTRDEGYQALGDLITKGFLTLKVDLGDNLLILKTINEKEYHTLRMLSISEDSKRFDLYYLAYSTLFLDNHSIISNRDKRLKSVVDFYSKMPAKICEKLLNELGGLRTVSFDSLKYLEGYSYTDDSRSKWLLCRGSFPNVEALTGIEGTTALGLNIHQESWMSLNRMMDDEEQYNRDFNMALFIASSNNPKGAKQVRGKHDAQKNTTEERRKKLAQEGYIDKKKKWTPEGWAVPVDTTEDLVEELERQMSGVKDKHDLFVARYLENLRNEATKRTQEAAEKIKAARTEGPDFDGYQRALTPEEVEKYIHKNQPNPGLVSVLDGMGPEGRDKFVQKVGSRIITGR
jgi:hypothetical protein